ncbi:hypothetical protein [Bacillus paralicheniformis]|uniref:hypothetical protein n=1 Tax=Bacillus paralicheniformis TaxID=1648923 RepID=UPI000BA5124B|nr:hypothetical protein [Bacillus paralicheniformis]PAC96338.1 hypothetical protein CHH86_14845 [Bacillus paralicheniformis]
MTKTNEKIHILADESLGGIKREYVEVDRKAKVGEKIVITSSDYEEREEIYVAGHYGKVDAEDDRFAGEFRVDFNGFDNSFVGDDGFWYVGRPTNSEYRVLEPTNIVHIDGERYEMVDRKAEVGEKVIHLSELYSEGTVTEVTGVGAGMVDVIEYEDSDGEITCGFSHGCYRVLVPLPKENEYQEFKDKKRGYKEVKNFIHNELGITKDDIQEMIRIAVSNEVKKAAESGEFQSFISSKIDSLIEEGFGDGGRLLYGFKERVSQTVSNEVGKRIANNLNISVELKSQ